MRKLIMIKYGELSTKKDNIGLFLNTLKKNIEYTLTSLEHEITFDKARMFITGNDIDQILTKVQNIFGIHQIVIAYELSDNTLENISFHLLNLLSSTNFNTF